MIKVKKYNENGKKILMAKATDLTLAREMGLARPGRAACTAKFRSYNSTFINASQYLHNFKDVTDIFCLIGGGPIIT